MCGCLLHQSHNHAQSVGNMNFGPPMNRDGTFLQRALTGTPPRYESGVRTESFGANLFLPVSFGTKPKTAVPFSSTSKSPVPFCPSHKSTFARTFFCRLGAKAYGANFVLLVSFVSNVFCRLGAKAYGANFAKVLL